MKPAIILIARRDFELEALAAILTDAGYEIGVCDPAGDSDRMFGNASLERYQLALITARIEDPLGTITSLSVSAPSIKVAMMVENATSDLVRNALSSGALGVIERKVSLATMVCQLELLALGGCVIPAGFVETLAKPQPPPPLRRVDRRFAKAFRQRKRDRAMHRGGDVQQGDRAPAASLRADGEGACRCYPAEAAPQQPDESRHMGSVSRRSPDARGAGDAGASQDTPHHRCSPHVRGASSLGDPRQEHRARREAAGSADAPFQIFRVSHVARTTAPVDIRITETIIRAAASLAVGEERSGRHSARRSG